MVINVSWAIQIVSEFARGAVQFENGFAYLRFLKVLQITETFLGIILAYV